MIKVSVIIPVFNGEEYVTNAIEDILGQTCRDLELILIDDGSADKTLELLKKYADRDSRIRLVEQEHRGAGAARNLGIDMASGKYLLFLDGDDRFDENLIERTFTEAERFSTDILMFDARVIDAVTGCETGSDLIVNKDMIPAKEVFSYEDFADTILCCCYSAVWTKLYLRDFIRRNSIRFQNTPYMNDVFFHHISLLEADRIHYLDEKLLSYHSDRKGAISSSERYENDPETACEIIKSVRDHLNRTNRSERSSFGFKANASRYLLEILEYKFHDIGSYCKAFKLFREFLLVDLKAGSIIGDSRVNSYINDNLTALSECDEKGFLMYLYCHSRETNRDISTNLLSVCRDFEKACRELDLLIRYKHWVFDSSVLCPGDRIIIYGAGEVGRDYHDQLLREGKVLLTGWVDKKYNDLPKNMGVESPEILETREWDKVIVAIRDQEISRDIKRWISDMGRQKDVLLMTDIMKI